MNSLSTLTSEFVGRISVAVWIGKLSDDAACEALEAYASACEETAAEHPARVHEAILAEYRYRRDGQDLCS